MKILLSFCLICMLALSCSNEAISEDDIVGEWNFEREIKSTILPDTGPLNPLITGTISFDSENNGESSSNNNGAQNYLFDWLLESEEEKITIVNNQFTNPAEGTLIYEIIQWDMNNLILINTLTGDDQYYRKVTLTLTR